MSTLGLVFGIIAITIWILDLYWIVTGTIYLAGKETSFSEEPITFVLAAMIYAALGVLAFVQFYYLYLR